MKMGYELTRFIGEIDEELKCSICTMVLEEPMQTPCEHLFCIECIKGWVAVDRSCPVDRLSLTSDSFKPAARYLRNMLGKLDIQCDFIPNGCQTVVKLECLQNHIANCAHNPNSEIICDMGCNLKMTRREYQVGMNCFTHLAERVIRQDEQILKLNDALERVIRQDEHILKLNDTLSGQQKHVDRMINHLQEQITKLNMDASSQHEKDLEKLANDVCNTQKHIRNPSYNQQEQEVTNFKCGSQQPQQVERRINAYFRARKNIATLNVNRQQEEIPNASDNSKDLIMPKWQKCRNIITSEITSAGEPNILELCMAKGISSFAQSFNSLEPGNSFKIQILNQGDVNSIGIGLTHKEFENVLGYYNIVYYNVGIVEYVEKFVINDNVGPKWKDGDFIECGILGTLRGYATVYFSRNEEIVKRKNLKMPSGGFFPTIFMKRHDGTVTKVKYFNNSVST